MRRKVENKRRVAVARMRTIKILTLKVPEDAEMGDEELSGIFEDLVADNVRDLTITMWGRNRERVWGISATTIAALAKAFPSLHSLTLDDTPLQPCADFAPLAPLAGLRALCVSQLIIAKLHV